MNYGLLISFISGICTIFGFFIIFLVKMNNKIIGKSLAFSSGIMVCISLMDLIPNSISNIKNNSIFLCFLFVTCGAFISYFINRILPDYNGFDNSKLYRIGILSMIVIVIHNIPEGIATFLTTNSNFYLGLKLAIAIALHNIPEGISIAIPSYFSTKSKIRTFTYVFVSGFSEFIGALFASIIFRSNNIFFYLGFIYAIIAGIMLYLCINELIPTSFKYSSGTTIKYFIFGFSVMLVVNFAI